MLSESLLAMIDQAAASRGISKSVLVWLAMEKELERSREDEKVSMLIFLFFPKKSAAFKQFSVPT